MPSIEDAADAIVVVVDAAVFATTGSRVQMPKRVGPQLVDDLRQEFRDEFGFRVTRDGEGVGRQGSLGGKGGREGGRKEGRKNRKEGEKGDEEENGIEEKGEEEEG